MSIQLHIGNSGGQLSILQQGIKEAFNLAKKEAVTRFSVNDVDVFVFQSEFGAIPELGFGGFTASQHTVFCYVSPQSKEIDSERLSAILLHELHHAKRYGTVGYGDTLGEAIITEGLACLIEEEYSCGVPMYAEVGLDTETIKLAKKELDSETYDHDAWFYGTRDLPRWAGYTLGYKICKNYSEKTGKSAGQLVDVAADKILKGFDPILF